MHNVGKIDRIIRIVIASALIILYFTKVLEASFFLILGLLLLGTSLRRCCPIYSILGFGTCGVKNNPDDKIIDTDKLNLRK
jgi:hypothetical protein